MKPKHADDGMFCPWWRKPCVKVCHTCEMWEQVRGKHPQTGQDIDHWSCTMKLHTMLQIEHTMATRQTTATVDSLRKEVREANDQQMVGAIARLNRQVDEARSAALPNGTAAPLMIAQD